MTHSSIEALEPRWAPARLVAGPLPAEFGVNLPADVPELEGLVAVLGTIELPEFGMWPTASSARLVVQWSRPDPAAGSQFLEGLGFQSSLPGGRPAPPELIERLSQDHQETLAAFLAARGELGETAGSVTFFNRPGRR